MAKATFEVPEDLVTAIEMVSFERQLPKQGNRDVLRHLVDPTDEDTAKKVEQWIEDQKRVWQDVDRVVLRLHEVAPVTELTPNWAQQEWWLVLGMPWSEQLAEAVKSADQWCDRQEDAKSS